MYPYRRYSSYGHILTVSVIEKRPPYLEYSKQYMVYIMLLTSLAWLIMIKKLSSIHDHLYVPRHLQIRNTMALGKYI